MNVLSLFDGISCGQIALERAGIKINTYFSSEIDKYAIAVTQHNYPKTIQLGDVTKINIKKLPKIDLLIGGSPCQGFSFAGKQLNFKDERSKLFFEYVKILDKLKNKNPNIIFILENVFMKKEYQNVISDYLEVSPIRINSSLVSAQNRKRLYWTNIDGIKQPKDKKIFLKDIIEKGIVDRDKSYCICASYAKGVDISYYIKRGRRQIAFTEIRTEKAKKIRKEFMKKHGVDFSPRRAKKQTTRNDGKMNCLTSSFNMKEHTLIDEKLYYRKLTPIECERLQTIQDNYTNHISNSQRYKALGNCFTVDVIVHILKGIKNGLKQQITQGFFSKKQIIKYRKVK